MKDFLLFTHFVYWCGGSSGIVAHCLCWVPLFVFFILLFFVVIVVVAVFPCVVVTTWQLFLPVVLVLLGVCLCSKPFFMYEQ